MDTWLGETIFLSIVLGFGDGMMDLIGIRIRIHDSILSLFRSMLVSQQWNHFCAIHLNSRQNHTEDVA